MKGALIVFAKAPRAGQVKTRLCPPLSFAEAASLYECMLADVLATSARVAPRLGLTPILAVYPPRACVELALRAPPAFRVIPQRGADLAARMTHAASEAAHAGFEPILLRGSDSPCLSGETLAEAVRGLESADLVLCPDRDGGYSLVGLRRPAPGLFDHPMSTISVLDDTLARAARRGLRAEVLEPGFDLDRIEDLRLLSERRRGTAASLCSRTLAYLDGHGIWARVGRIDQGDGSR